jgi:hypothetical protein
MAFFTVNKYVAQALSVKYHQYRFLILYLYDLIRGFWYFMKSMGHREDHQGLSSTQE